MKELSRQRTRRGSMKFDPIMNLSMPVLDMQNGVSILEEVRKCNAIPVIENRSTRKRSGNREWRPDLSSRWM
jgi:hypothetical protein